ncbi:MAG: hypothetical protein H7Z75_16945 [Ferruginibacter sp.]|nr:hypothetical protein [Cytophagales bacterium]
MKNMALPLLFLALFLGAGSCEKDDAQPAASQCNLPACDPGRKTIAKVRDAIGIVGYRNGRYAISVGQPGTYDSQVTGIVCQMPDKFKVNGSKVTFNGEYKEYCPDTVQKDTVPQFPGQIFYYLHLTNIHLTDTL